MPLTADMVASTAALRHARRGARVSVALGARLGDHGRRRGAARLAVRGCRASPAGDHGRCPRALFDEGARGLVSGSDAGNPCNLCAQVLAVDEAAARAFRRAGAAEVAVAGRMEEPSAALSLPRTRTRDAGRVDGDAAGLVGGGCACGRRSCGDRRASLGVAAGASLAV